MPHGGSGGMATNVTLTPPEKFDFRRPDEWPKWKRRFQQFLTASGLADANSARKVSTLLYCLGEEGDDVLTSTDITEDGHKNYDTIMEKWRCFSE